MGFPVGARGTAEDRLAKQSWRYHCNPLEENDLEDIYTYVYACIYISIEEDHRGYNSPYHTML